ncbi:MAG: arsenite methyltransferase [Candidatus Hydrogenedentes bacterium]|nr:arsenite methyltransferase [Candidatus Hydrogenedentota bacterium]
MATTETSDIKKNVRERYASVVTESTSCCGSPAADATACCGTAPEDERSGLVGYSQEELNSLPEGANLGLGCGNPLAFASIQEGDTVLDLGSGGGIDCFLAAKQVGDTGNVIGIDMTPEMLERARANAEKGGYTNVEFRLGEIEALPVADATVDLVISNCVINLSPEKDRVFREIFRVLKPGGQFFVSDIVLSKPLPEVVQRSVAAYAGCVAGALMKEDYLQTITDAGFSAPTVLSEDAFPISSFTADPTVKALVADAETIPEEAIRDAQDAILSIKIKGIKEA